MLISDMKEVDGHLVKVILEHNDRDLLYALHIPYQPSTEHSVVYVYLPSIEYERLRNIFMTPGELEPPCS